LCGAVRSGTSVATAGRVLIWADIGHFFLTLTGARSEARIRVTGLQ
jgi:hypothetical protein